MEKQDQSVQSPDKLLTVNVSQRKQDQEQQHRRDSNVQKNKVFRCLTHSDLVPQGAIKGAESSINSLTHVTLRKLGEETAPMC